MDFLFFPFVGFIVGMMVGISGMGGGSLMTPILIISGISAQVAITTDLLFAAITKILNISLQNKRVVINGKILGCMMAGSLSGVIIMNHFFKKHFATFGNVDFVLTVSLAGILMITALGLFVLTWIPKYFKTTVTLLEDPQYSSISNSNFKLVITFLIAIFIGGSVALTSVGSGVLGVVALLWLYPKLPIRQVVSIDICYAIPLTLLSWCSLSFFHDQTSDYTLLFQLLAGSMVGTVVSVLLLKRLNRRVICSLMIVLILIASAKLLHKALLI